MSFFLCLSINSRNNSSIWTLYLIFVSFLYFLFSLFRLKSGKYLYTICLHFFYCYLPQLCPFVRHQSLNLIEACTCFCLLSFYTYRQIRGFRLNYLIQFPFYFNGLIKIIILKSFPYLTSFVN